MNLFAILKGILRYFCIPVIAVFFLGICNIFDYISFIPKDYRYEIGLSGYIGILEWIYDIIKDYIEKNRAYIKCFFYITEDDKNIFHTVCVPCVEQVITLKCELELSGNLKKLRKSRLNLSLPDWLTPQIDSNDLVLEYLHSQNENSLCWKFESLLPTLGDNDQKVKYRSNISLITNIEHPDLEMKFSPNMKKNIGITFEKNAFKIQNGE